MPIHLNLEILDYDQVRTPAKNFLDGYDHRIGPPVQIEEIVELDLGIEVVPFPGIKEDFDIEGFTSSDLSTIYIDQSVFDHKIEHRYRFTLAHELGHFIMHQSIFKKFRFTTLEEYCEFTKEVDKEDYRWLENQAYWVAGLLLVPSDLLKTEFEKQLSHRELREAIRVAKEHGLDKPQYSEHVMELMAQRIARIFHVSTQVVVKRLGYDKLTEQLP